ncbi:MAG: hypothetical protein NVSMB53_10410 [Gemmatimonadaceae bacterium]
MSAESEIAPVSAFALMLILAIGADASAQIKVPHTHQPGSLLADSLVVDSFDSVSQWTTNPAKGVEITVHSDSGRHGRAMRVDFDFHGHPGYGIVHRDVNLDLPANYEFTFAVRGEAPTNTLEFKLIDPTYANVWWSNNPNFIFPHEWTTIARKKRQICFAWGPAGWGEIHRAAAIEFAITAGSGGRGSVWIDDLALTPLKPDSPFDLTVPVASIPIVGSWESAATTNGAGVKLDFAPDGSLRSTVGVMGDFTYTLGDNLLRTSFKEVGPDKSDYTNPIRVERDAFTQTGTNLFGTDVTMRRVGPVTEASDPIFGFWSYSDDTAGIASVAFLKNGRGLFRRPISSCSGTWTDSGAGHLAVSMNGQVPMEWDYSIDNAVLTTRDAHGREAKYNRRTPSW